MSHFSNDVKEWLLTLGSNHGDTVLTAMEEEAKINGFPIVGPEVGRLLFQLATMTQAKRVFELGSGFGYSTVWFARAVGPKGRVFHTDGDIENTNKAREYLDQAGLLSRVVPSTGDAREILKRTPGPFDIVFMDIDKEQYPSGYELFKDQVAVGGLVIVDNLVWSGKVAAGEKDEQTAGIREYIDLMWNNPNYISSLMPVRDGVGVSLRIK
jgi:caffeoyl-CoA O-methyltransferase